MIELFMIHTASVETYQGAGPTGPVYAAPVDVPCLLEDGLVLAGGASGTGGSSASGQQWVNKTTLYTYLDKAAVLTVSSRLTCNGRSMIVTGMRRKDGGDILADVTHLEVDVS